MKLELPSTMAGRLAWVRHMLLGPPIVDEDGKPTGERSGPLITEEQARELLEILR